MNDPEPEQHEDTDAIEARGLGGSFRIPVSRKDIGPSIKWLIMAFALAVVIVAAGFAWSLAK